MLSPAWGEHQLRDFIASLDDDMAEMYAVRAWTMHSQDPQRAWEMIHPHLTAAQVSNAESAMPWLRGEFHCTHEGEHHCACADPDLRWDNDDLICYDCGVVRTHLVHTLGKEDWVDAEDFVPRHFPRRYAPSSRFRTVLRSFMANVVATVPGDVETLLRSRLVGAGVDPRACCGADVRRAVRSIKRADLYPLVPGLVAQLRGDPPLRISTGDADAAMGLFQHIISTGSRGSRVYFPSYRTVLIQVLEAVGVRNVRVYAAELTHRRSRARASKDVGALVARACRN